MIERIGIKLVKRLTYIALALLGAIFILSYLIVNNAQDKQNEDSYNISIVSKQRTITLNISRIVMEISSGESVNEDLMNELSENKEKLQKTYEMFVSNARVKKLINDYDELKNVPEETRLYKEKIIDGVETILQSSNKRDLISIGVKDVIDNDQEFISRIEKTLGFYVLDARENIKYLQNVRLILLLLMIGLLLVFGIVLFRPTIRDAEKHFVELVEIKRELEEINGELTQNNHLLEKSVRSLEASNEQLESFTYVISHDLKAPLRAISNLSEWIEEDLSDDIENETKEHLNMLRGRVERLNNLIDGVLEYSRAARLTRDVEPVNVNELVEQVAFELGVKDFVQIPSSLPSVLTNEEMLKKVFYHLIKNAVHFSSNNPRVSITSVTGDGVYAFTIKDNGIGIAKESQEKIFEIFHTLQSKDKEDTKGVGLAIVHRILNDINGSISVKSELEKGSEFTFIWPAVIS